MDVKLVVGFSEKEVKDMLIERVKSAAGQTVAGMGATIELDFSPMSAGDVKPLIVASVAFNGKAQ